MDKSVLKILVNLFGEKQTFVFNQSSVNDLIEVTPLCTTPGEVVYPNQIKIFSFKFKIRQIGKSRSETFLG